MWIVLAGRGHNSEQLGHGFTEDLHEAKAKIDGISDGFVRRAGLTGPPRYWTWTAEDDVAASGCPLACWAGRPSSAEVRDSTLRRAMASPGLGQPRNLSRSARPNIHERLGVLQGSEPRGDVRGGLPDLVLGVRDRLEEVRD